MARGAASDPKVDYAMAKLKNRLKAGVALQLAALLHLGVTVPVAQAQNWTFAQAPEPEIPGKPRKPGEPPAKPSELPARPPTAAPASPPPPAKPVEAPKPAPPVPPVAPPATLKEMAAKGETFYGRFAAGRKAAA